MAKSNDSLYRAYLLVEHVIRYPDSYVSFDDRPELVAVRNKLRELSNRIKDREEDDKHGT